MWYLLRDAPAKHRGIFERPKGSGIWWIDYRDSLRRRHREKVGRKNAARDAWLERKIEIREGRFIPPRGAADGPTFRELARQRMEWAKLRLKPASYRTDSQRLGPLLEAFGDLAASAVTAEKIRNFLSGILERGRTQATANRYFWLLHSIFSLAVSNERLVKSPCAKVAHFKESPGRIRFLIADEEKRLRAAIEAERAERIPDFELALNTGMRRGEQYSLKWPDVDLERSVLTVTGKTGRRYVVINSLARSAIEQLRARARGEPVCSPLSADERLWFERVVKNAGIAHFRWHDLRHTFASRLVMAGVDIRTVQELLGHKSVVTTMRYAHLSQDHRQQAVEKLVEAKA